MTEWILVRHGVTEWNQDGRYQGQSDSALSDEGCAQAEDLARSLASRHVEAIFSSDLQRARHTAEEIARPHGLPVRLDTRLREIGLGDWEGMLVTDITARYPGEWRAIMRDPLHARAPGGESVDEVAQRAMACLRDVAARHPSGPVILVTHGLTMACIMLLMEGLPLELARQRIPPNCAAIELVWP
jgi:broad specificity phosphatase PhoE